MFFSSTSRRTFIAFILIFCSSLSLTILALYSLTQFLSNYPPTLIAIYLASSAFLNIISRYSVGYFLFTEIKKHSLIVTASIFVLTIFMIVFSQINLYWMPFGLALLASLMSSSIFMVSWNLVPLAFGIREYKEVVVYLVRGSALGAILGSLLVAFLLKFFHINFLLVFVSFMLACCMAAIYMLPIFKESDKKTKSNISPLKYSLFRNILIFSIGLIASKVLINYVFNYSVSLDVPKDDIGEFIGYFNGIVNTLGFLSSVLISKRIQDFIRLQGVLLITPVLMLIFSLAALAYPSLWIICFLASLKAIFYNTYNKMGVEISLNILSFNTRVASKSYLNTIVPVVELSALLVPLIMTDHHGISFILWVIAALAVLCIYFVNRIVKAYQSTLQKEFEFKRFNITNEFNPDNMEAYQEGISKALHSKDIRTILFGITLLNKLSLPKLPENFYSLLNHSDVLIRSAVITTLKTRHDKEAFPYLQDRLHLEKDPEVKLKILDALIDLDLGGLVPIALELKKEKLQPLYPIALGILLDAKNDTHYSNSLNELQTLAKDSDSLNKIGIAYVIGRFKIAELESTLRDLILDRDDQVSIESMLAAGSAQNVNLINTIVSQLSNPRRCFTAQKAINSMGSSALPSVSKYFSDQKSFNFIVKAISRIPGVECEQVLIKLYHQGSIIVKTLVAREANYRALQIPVSYDFKLEASSIALEEIYHVVYLNELLFKRFPPHVNVEILSRIKLAKERLLLWVAIATDPKIINSCIPSLLSSSTVFTSSQAKGKALELLEIYLADNSLKQTIVNILENKMNNITSFNALNYSDSWLAAVMKYELDNQKLGKKMDNFYKVFELRAVDLFKDVPGEILLAIAEETIVASYNEGDIIFHENDYSDGLYCISSGNVKIIRHDKVLKILKTHDFFGELGIIDDSPRTASAVAMTDCTLLKLEKSTFDRITDDLPEVLRMVTKAILGYLRANMQDMQ